ncbi:ABC transporter substrate-binding protein [Primorskyibacter sp. S187A]|uniref:ABC transporter substrate-binding protein n=1 Tax=Primorskyibacter sp. S187A TaxID=3415130 RepID=UPI003C7B683C
MRNSVLLIVGLCTFMCGALALGPPLSTAELEDQTRFGPDPGDAALRILSSTDTEVFAPIIEAYLADQPDLSIVYDVAGSADIVELLAACEGCYDIVISSAMDLQMKLANDGAARPLPDLDPAPWAVWRESLFGFTLEPATILLNAAHFKDRPIPQTRQELIATLRAEPETFAGRVGTYDVRLSGLGYLFATQDARTSETYWRLMEVFGSLEAKLYCCSGEMIDALAAGELLVAYNVLGSYANARLDARGLIEIVAPQDFATTMMRTALVLDSAAAPERAEAFVAHLVSNAWARETGGTEVDAAPLPPLSRASPPQQGLIRLEPGLLVYLDTLKRKIFLEEWRNALRR